MVNVYFISGMGADGRLFKHIRLPEGFRMNFVDWIEPGREETIPAYASRLAEHMDTTRPFVLVGVSLGGIMSVEIAKRYSTADSSKFVNGILDKIKEERKTDSTGDKVVR